MVRLQAIECCSKNIFALVQYLTKPNRKKLKRSFKDTSKFSGGDKKSFTFFVFFRMRTFCIGMCRAENVRAARTNYFRRQ